MSIAGIWTASITPLDSSGAVDHTKLAEHCMWLADHGDGVVLFGSTGEAPSFSLDERTEALERLISSGFDPAILVVGTGCSSLPETVALTQHATELDVAGSLVIPPYFYKGVSDQGVLNYYRDLIDQSPEDLALYLYNFPKLSGVTLSPALVKTLFRQHPTTIKGIKDSTGEWASSHAFLGIEGLHVYPGNERLLADSQANGAAGVITATGNLNVANISRAWKTGADLGEMVAVREILEESGTIVGSKAWLSHRHDDPAWRAVRSPFVAADDVATERLVRQLSNYLPA